LQLFYEGIYIMTKFLIPLLIAMTLSLSGCILDPYYWNHGWDGGGWDHGGGGRHGGGGHNDD
jgi:hypothetical protein